MLLGGPATPTAMPPIPDEAEALQENDTFRALIGRQHEAVMAALVEERWRVARKFGVRDLPDLDAWLRRHAGAMKGEGSRPVPGHPEAAIVLRNATIGSLVPLVSAACIADETVPVTESMVTLAGTVLGANMEQAGRRLDKIGIDSSTVEGARRILDAIAGGVR